MSKVRCEVKGHLATITVNNPPMNPLDVEVMDGLRNSFEHLLLEPDIRAVILTGEGKAFIAGADIKELKSWTPEASLTLNGKGQALVGMIEAFPAPVIAAINGYALGGGLEIAMGCDIRIASEKAKVGLPEVKLGIIPGYGGTVRLPRSINIGAAKKMLFTAQHITAMEALSLGLIQEAVPSESLLARATEIAEQISANAPLAVQAIKRAVNAGRSASIGESLHSELLEAKNCYATADRMIGIEAFIRKETPEFIRK